MRLFGFDITRSKALQPADNRGGWWGVIREAYTGAWQSNVEVRVDTVLTFHAVFRCISLISGDIAKMRLHCIAQQGDIWLPVSGTTWDGVVKKPNRFQTRIQFYTNWMESKLIHGNTYILKERDNRANVVALYILDPNRVTPLVADDGSIFYQLGEDRLSGLNGQNVVVPASEIIHDRWNTLYHPLVGVSPIHAAGVAAVQGLNIQNNSAKFFGNHSQPGGILTAPGAISDETAKRLKESWESNYSGKNFGKVAVVGDGLKYEAMAIKPVDAQLIEQLKWSAETVCSVFGVPAYMAGVGSAPQLQNIEALTSQYYSQCLQIHIEGIEALLSEGLAMPATKGVQFNLDDLMRMDTATLVEAEANAVGSGIKSPNESRKRFNLLPVPGGDNPYLQQQNYSLEALARRDLNEMNPTPEPAPAVTPEQQAEAVRMIRETFERQAA